MSASVVVRCVKRWSGEPPPFLTPVVSSTEILSRYSTPELCLRELIKKTGLTVSQVSVTSARLYGHSSRFFIPATFLSKLKAGVSPHLCQLAALSRITGISFWQCMEVCGLDAQLISSLQLRLQRNKTVLLSSPVPPEGRSRGRFVKVGKGDSQVLPELASDSILPVKATCQDFVPRETDQSRLWLVQHERGLICCRLGLVDRDHVRILPSQSPFWAWPLKLNREVSILGEIDFFGSSSICQGFSDRGIRNEQCSIAPPDYRITFSRLLQKSRSRAGLTFRAAQELSSQVAQLLGPAYAIGLGALCDYETMDRVPRHIEKIFSLCIVYCMDFMEVLETAGIRIRDSGETRIESLSLNSMNPYHLAEPRLLPTVLRARMETSTLGRAHS